MNDHPLAAILRNAKRLREVSRKRAHPVNPRAAPEVTRFVWSPKADVGGSVPSKGVENDGAVLADVGRSEGEPDRSNGLASRVGQAPTQGRLGARRQNGRLAIDRSQFIVPAVDEKAQRDLDAAPIALAGDHARAQGLSGVDERRRHQVVGAHARHVGSGEGRRSGARLETQIGVAERERPPLFERLVYDVERGAVAPARPEPLHGSGQRKMELRPVFGGTAAGRPASRRPRSTRR